MMETANGVPWGTIRISLARLALAATLVGAGCTKAKPAEQVASQNASLRNSPIIAARLKNSLSTVSASAEKICYWNDKKYSDGALVCENHRRRECWTDKWVDIGNC
jgi:hypothetical protein